MTRVFLANAKPEERSALRLLILDLRMDEAGEACDCATTFAQAPVSRTDMLLLGWDLLPNAPTVARDELRVAPDRGIYSADVIQETWACEVAGNSYIRAETAVVKPRRP